MTTRVTVRWPRPDPAGKKSPSQRTRTLTRGDDRDNAQQHGEEDDAQQTAQHQRGGGPPTTGAPTAERTSSGREDPAHTGAPPSRQCRGGRSAVARITATHTAGSTCATLTPTNTSAAIMNGQPVSSAPTTRPPANEIADAVHRARSALTTGC